MKLFATVPVVLLALMTVGLSFSCHQHLDRYEAGVGDEVMVVLTLGNEGDFPLDVKVTPTIQEGLMTAISETWTLELFPGEGECITYPVRGEAPGKYNIFTNVIYTTENASRDSRFKCGDQFNRMLLIEDPLTEPN